MRGTRAGVFGSLGEFTEVKQRFPEKLMGAETKIYIILLDNMPLQSTLNTVALLSMGLAKVAPELVGPEVVDSEGNRHLGIGNYPIIIMKAKTGSKLKRAYDTLKKEGFQVVPFFEHSRNLGTYVQYQRSMKEIVVGELTLSGISTFGEIDRLRPHLKRFSLWK